MEINYSWDDPTLPLFLWMKWRDCDITFCWWVNSIDIRRLPHWDSLFFLEWQLKGWVPFQFSFRLVVFFIVYSFILLSFFLTWVSFLPAIWWFISIFFLISIPSLQNLIIISFIINLPISITSTYSSESAFKQFRSAVWNFLFISSKSNHFCLMGRA